MTVRGFESPATAPPSRIPRVKICGVRDLATATVCAQAGVDYLGLVFVAASPRAVTPEQAAGITRALPELGPRPPEAIGLFCDHDLAEVLAIARLTGLGCVQLHGQEPPEDVTTLAEAGLTVWKAIAFAPDGLARWAGVPGLAAVLVDAPPPVADAAASPRGGRALTGGHGAVFDWHALAAVDRRDLPPLWLAGGLTPHNVAEAIRVVRPCGVDVSSGVEAERGVKDSAAVRAFAQAARNA